MNLLKNITLDFAHVNGGEVIRIHEGDHNASSFSVSLYNNGVAFSLTGLTVKYDAVIDGYLAENDAAGSGSGNVATIPITPNMTARSGKLLVDIKIIEGTGDNQKILFTQTITAWVERSIIDEAVIIDISGTTIGGRLDALYAKFPVVTEDIADGAVTGAKIASGVIPTKISELANDGIYRRLGYVSESQSYTATTYNGVSGTKPDFGVGDVVIMNGVLWRVTAVAEQVGGGWSYTLSSIGLATSKLYNDAGFVSDVSGKEDKSNKVTTMTGNVNDDKYPSVKAVNDKLIDNTMYLVKSSIQSTVPADSDGTAPDMTSSEFGLIRIGQIFACLIDNVRTYWMKEGTSAVCPVDSRGKMNYPITVPVTVDADHDSTADVPMGQVFKYDGDYYIKNSAATPVSAQYLVEYAGNKVTSIDSYSTDMQYPSAKCVFDMIGDVESVLASLL